MRYAGAGEKRKTFEPSNGLIATRAVAGVAADGAAGVVAGACLAEAPSVFGGAAAGV